MLKSRPEVATYCTQYLLKEPDSHTAELSECDTHDLGL